MVIKSAVAFFFLFFLHGTSIGNGQQGISYNVLGIGDVAHCTRLQFNDKLNGANSTKPLLWAVRYLTTNFKMEVNKIYHDDWMNNQLPDKSVQLIIAENKFCL